MSPVPVNDSSVPHYVHGHAEPVLRSPAECAAFLTALGDIYTTYVVKANGTVVHYRTRIGANGDETLPP